MEKDYRNRGVARRAAMPVDGRVARLTRNVSEIKRAELELVAASQGRWQQLVCWLADKAPLPPGLKDRFDPLESVRRGLRDKLIAMYGNMSDLIEMVEERLEYFDELRELVEVAEGGGTENVEVLRAFLLERVGEELGFVRDERVEQLLARVYERGGEKYKAQRRTELLAQARRILKLGEPIVEAMESVLGSTAKEWEVVNLALAKTLAVKDGVSGVRRASDDLAAAMKMELVNDAVLIGFAERTVERAELAAELVSARVSLSVEGDERLEKLRQRALRLAVVSDIKQLGSGK